MQPVLFRDLGLIDYKEAWEYQEKLFQELIERKLKNRALPVEEQEQQHHYLLFCEHPHVYTLGRSGLESNLLLDEEGLKSIDAVFYKNNRGGDITYHGPGQIVGYPILDLDLFFTDIHKYVRFLEEAIILTLKDYNISAGRFPGYTGVWLDPEDEKKARKICAIGVRTSRWVTMHGFAFNVNSNLNYFANIIPCGIEDKAVTSLEKELGAKQNISEVKAKVKEHLGVCLGWSLEL
ncbi:MAG: lipoyl(octanoyl) transferase LipB [Bacteroidetes bacterium]|nr:lipoyl(octanoyl) transferase LipB [Bacteroidota bacterium]